MTNVIDTMLVPGSPEAAPASAFARLEPACFDREPEWLRAWRRRSIARFEELGFPTTKLEAWRYTNMGRIAKAGLVPSIAYPAPETPSQLDGVSPLLGDTSMTHLVFVDGRFALQLNAADDAGVQVQSLAGAVADPENADLESRLGAGRPSADDEDAAMVALNAAFFADGGYVSIPAGITLSKPVHLCFVSTTHESEVVHHPRTLVVLGDGSRATIVESHVGQAGAYVSNAVVELSVGAGAAVDHYVLHEGSPEGSHFATTRASIERDGEVRSHLFALGGALARYETEVSFRGPGASCSLNGVYVGNDEQHVECRTAVDHAVPHCTSDQHFNGILSGKARGVFQGGVLVRPDAQQSVARQNNRNLVLSDRAKADTKPQLEIHADDVQCAHGATIGQLDEDAVFFLRSRGIDEATARVMLTRAFAGEIAEGIRVDSVLEHVQGELSRLLSDVNTPKTS